MGYERKYKEALERMKSWVKGEHPDCFSDAQKVAEFIFPELKESEDEKIRKELIEQIYYITPQQNELNEDLDTLPCYEERIERYRAWLEKQGEQKSSDKTEPKFRVGDYIKHNKANIICKIISVNSGSYYVENIETNGGIELFNAEQNFHLWTIKDTKDGDVLAYATDEGDSWIMIYRSLYEPYEGHVHYHALLVNDNFSDKGTCCICIDNLKPATKEQRDLLFTKMKEAGYEWRQEEKKLIKINESKFKVGYWITNGGANPCYVKSIFGDYYELCSCEGFEHTKHIIDVNYIYHFWTINDAKDGDVLIYQDEIFLFNLVDNGYVHFHCCYDGELITHNFYDFSYKELSDVHPATKEQRDILFQKMKEAGYEWNAEKKELCKYI